MKLKDEAIDTHLETNPFSLKLHLPVLIDADIITYQAGFSKDVTTEKDAIMKVDNIVSFVYENTSSFDMGQYEFYLTGKGNFRNDVAVTAEYKANRKGKPKPEHIDFIRSYLKLRYNAKVSEGQECDDDIATRANELGYNCICSSIDKDFLQIPSWHYNFGRNEWYKPSEWEGLKFFYSQILTGDGVDNIVGLWRIGPVKAYKMLEGCTTEQELYDACLKAYDNDADRVLENARLLWLRRTENEMWVPPQERFQ